jgi:hypothetical protein
MNKRIATIVALVALLLVPALAFAQSSSTGNRRTIPDYTVTITANVRDAQVFVDGSLRSRVTPATVSLQRGTYTIRVEARGYEVWEERITVDSDRTIRVQLRQPYATVLLSIPREFLNTDIRNPMAQIDFYIDGQLRDESRIQVRSGTHRVAIVSGGLKFEGEMYFESGMIYTLELILRLNMIQRVEVSFR